MVQNNNTGQFVLKFDDATGVGSRSASIEIAGGNASLRSTQTTGDLTTTDIIPTSSGGWQEILVEGAWGQTDAVKAQLLDCSGSPLPDATMPGNSTGLALTRTGKINLSSLGTTPSCLRVKILLTDSTGTNSPAISKLTVSWTAKTVYLARLTAPATTPAGDTINYRLDYSVSYSDDIGSVAYVPVPAATAGSFKPEYNQNPNLVFSKASNGGAFTSTAIVVNGVNVPANSVYWNLGNPKAGSAGSLSFALRTTNGWQNGITYEAKATIGSNETATKNSNTTTTKIQSKPTPNLTKTPSNIITVNGKNYAYNRSPYSSRATYNINYRNPGTSSGAETIFNPVVTDDVAPTIKFLTEQCGLNATTAASRITNITNDGVYDTTAQTITWRPAHIAPNAGFSASFSVDYSGCKEGAEVTNTATGTSDNGPKTQNSTTVRMFDVPMYVSSFAKGENGTITPAQDDNAPDPDPASMTGKTAYGETTTYNLRTSNEGLAQLADIVMRDMIPAGSEFVSATLPTAANGKVFYYTDNDYPDKNTPPDFDYANQAANPGTKWTQTPPATSSSVAWVAMYIPCLSSSISAGASGGCTDKPSSVTGNITVKALKPADVCSATDLENIGIQDVFSTAQDLSDQSILTSASPAIHKSDLEKTRATSPLPNINTGTNVTGPASVDSGSSAVYDIQLVNNSPTSSTTPDTTMTITIPTVQVGSDQRPLDYLGFSGGTVTTVNRDDDNNVTSIIVKPGVLAPGTTKNYKLTLGIPKGVIDDSKYTVSVSVAAQDVNKCQNITATKTATTEINGTPQLNTIKTRDESMITSSGEINYNLSINSSGTVSTTATFVVDQIPAKTIFQGTTCPAATCTVYFAAAGNPKLPSVITPENPITSEMVRDNFAIGTANGDSWMPPTAMPPDTVGYVAYMVGDILRGKLRILPVGDEVKMQLTVKNDHDGSGPETDGSPNGTIISNYPSTTSIQTLPAVANTVYTTVLPSPGLEVKKSASTDTASSGKSLEWYIDYTNTGDEPDTLVTLTDTLPAGVTLTGIYNTLNQKAATGASATTAEVKLWDTTSKHDSITVAQNTNGTTTITARLAPELIPQLAVLGGGRLKITVDTAPDLTSGTYLLNHVEGCYANANSNTTCLSDDNVVTISNPDLYLRKVVNNANPHKGDTVTYSLTISNEGNIAAPDVIIQDILPTGLTYKGNLQVLTPGWSLPSPVQNNPQTLLWDKTIKKSNLDAGIIPARSGNIIISYDAYVGDDVNYGSELRNQASVTTSTQEDNIYQNEERVPVTTATPDPYINKHTSSPSVMPGEPFKYTLQYGNTAGEKAEGVYIIDALPDIQGADGKTDTTILTVAGSNQEKIYYYDANIHGDLPTDINYATYNFTTDTRFKTSLADFDPAGNPASYPTHLVIVQTSKDNDNILDYYEYSGQIVIEAKAVNPYTNASLPLGSEWTNHAQIYSSTPDSNTNNNQSSVTNAVPSADLAINKSADIEGSYPGLAPGGAINYKITYQNSGVGDVCAVKIIDTIPTQVGAYSYNFPSVKITDATGKPIALHNDQGQPLSPDAEIPVSYDNSDPNNPIWYLGQNTDSANTATYYRNICLPTGARGSFEINATLKSELANKTEVKNIARIGHDVPGLTENITTNNQDDSTTMVYLSDLILVKSATVAGRDGAFGTSDDSTTEANVGETIRYRLEYNNIGNISARDSSISENIPEGTCFTAGSITNLPATAKVLYSNDQGTTWDYLPNTDNAPDCNVTNFRVELGEIPAPANMLSGTTVLHPKPIDYSRKPKNILADKTILFAAMGNTHTCVIASDYKFYCWGSGNTGELGDGNSASSILPVAVDMTGAMAGKTAAHIVTGNRFTCALEGGGTAYCWGTGTSGQLGNNTTSSSTIPYAVQMPASVSFAELFASSGSTHACALGTQGSLYCWGNNASGQLGDGTTTNSLIPKLVDVDGKPVTRVAVGNNHTCATTEDFAVYCWGNNQNGQLGTGDTTSHLTPTLVPGIADIAQISAGENFTCAFSTVGTAYCWGAGTSGQLGNNLNTDSLTPVPVNMPSGVTFQWVSSGGSGTCGLGDDGQTYCWGVNAYFQLGVSGGSTTLSLPKRFQNATLLPDKTITFIAKGGNHTCEITGEGLIYCIGSDNSGQLGDGDPVTTSDFQLVKVGGDNQEIDPSTLADFKADSVFASSHSSTICAISEGNAYCWGDNAYGQIGDGTRTASELPVLIKGELEGQVVTKISSGYLSTCAVTLTGKVYCWGNNSGGLLGTGQNQDDLPENLAPIAIDLSNTTQPIKDVFVGSNHACLIDANDQVYCWGSNGSGQLGFTGPNTATPQAVDTSGDLADKHITQLTASSMTTCAVDTNGDAYCWGMNNFGQMGTTIGEGAYDPHLPTKINMAALGGDAVVSIHEGQNFTCLLTTTGKVYCFGSNESGQLGRPTEFPGTTSVNSTPQEIDMSGALSGLTIKQLSTGRTHSCVVASDDRIYCWGGLGAETTYTPAPTPLDPVGPLTDKDIRQVSAGNTVTCAIDAEKSVYCWGINYDAAPTHIISPQQKPTSDTKTLKLSAPTGSTITSYDSLYIDQRTGDLTFPTPSYPNTTGTVNYYLKQMVSDTCSIDNPDVSGFGSPIFTAPANTNASKVIDISSLDKNTRDWCFVSDYIDSGDLTSTIRMSYASPDNPYITFDAKVDSSINQTIIPNTAGIDTSTPEITGENNTGNYRLTVPQADLITEKTVDKAAVSQATAASGTQLTYTIIVKNNGPHDAFQPVITDTLSDDLTFASATQASSSDGAGGTSAVDFTCTVTSQKVACQSDTPLLAGESATITLRANIDTDIADGKRIMNSACATSETADADTNNNCGQTFTSITTAPNVWLKKTGPATTNINKQFTYTLTFGNNGNGPATDWNITDDLDSNLTPVGDPVVTSDPATITCTTSGQTITCTTPDGTLPAGATGKIAIKVRVANNQSLSDNSAIIHNTACTATSTTQTDISDDCADHDIKVTPGQLASLAGRVFMDFNTNAFYDNNEKPLTGVTITLTGTDSKGRSVNLTTTTDKNGNYFFYNLHPGTYTVTETQPANHNSTGSTGGYLETNNDGKPLKNDKNGKGSVQLGSTGNHNRIIDIVLGEGDFSQGNDFGELCGTIGNYVWHDANRNGFADSDETGIPGVEVTLFIDNDGDSDAGDPTDTKVASILTDSGGYYEFTELDLTPGQQYLVEVTDADGVIKDLGYAPTYAPDTTDENGVPYYRIDQYSGHLKTTPYYDSAKIGLTMSPLVTWFDWMNPTPAVAPFATPVYTETNLTADFGYAKAETGPGDNDPGDDNPGDNDPKDNDPGPNPPQTGSHTFLPDHAVLTLSSAATVIIIITAALIYRKRKSTRKHNP